jgi:YHS domain-containing protein
MRHIGLFSATLSVLILCACGGGGQKEATQEKAPEAAAQSQVVDMHNTVCPVSGEAAVDSVFVIYQGKKIHLCCAQCESAFLANPEKYLSMLEKGEVPKTGMMHGEEGEMEMEHSEQKEEHPH